MDIWQERVLFSSHVVVSRERAKTGASFRAFRVPLHDLVSVASTKDGGRQQQEWLRMNISQQILALDARYNAYRVPNNPQYRKYFKTKSRFQYVAIHSHANYVSVSLIASNLNLFKTNVNDLSQLISTFLDSGTLYIRRRNQLLRENAKKEVIY